MMGSAIATQQDYDWLLKNLTAILFDFREALRINQDNIGLKLQIIVGTLAPVSVYERHYNHWKSGLYMEKVLSSGRTVTTSSE